jgi:hypothetical protein
LWLGGRIFCIHHARNFASSSAAIDTGPRLCHATRLRLKKKRIPFHATCYNFAPRFPV